MNVTDHVAEEAEPAVCREEKDVRDADGDGNRPELGQQGPECLCNALRRLADAMGKCAREVLAEEPMRAYTEGNGRGPGRLSWALTRSHPKLMALVVRPKRARQR